MAGTACVRDVLRRETLLAERANQNLDAHSYGNSERQIGEEQAHCDVVPNTALCGA